MRSSVVLEAPVAAWLWEHDALVLAEALASGQAAPGDDPAREAFAALFDGYPGARALVVPGAHLTYLADALPYEADKHDDLRRAQPLSPSDERHARRLAGAFRRAIRAVERAR